MKKAALTGGRGARKGILVYFFLRSFFRGSGFSEFTRSITFVVSMPRQCGVMNGFMSSSLFVRLKYAPAK